ncbi:polysaccharide biosynthesis/export family protein [Flammeovirgaceae bacterium SG7u.111]|nr:polysaccharide biosynthesis/export family protein [Flammeovirgaceae bacterium SG7u.132]WPO36528.1 polysaccharide biosynthesis/export family protein [Flammeovirgaceae bacterium SG7u.111]
MNYLNTSTLLLLATICLQSCASFKQNILFSTENEINPEVFDQSFNRAVKAYRFEPYDVLAFTIYTNNGERLIDPNAEFEIGDQPSISDGGVNRQQQQNQQGGQTNSLLNFPITSNNMAPRSYLLDESGVSELPLIGKVKLGGFTLEQADSLLSEKYATYYEKPFVKTQYLNKRVIIMGALGDMVMPLRNENMTLVEVLALAGSVQNRSKPDKIRLIRGDVENPSVKIIDLTTMEGYTKSNIIVEPNDIIYVEAKRRLDRETFTDLTVLLTPITAITSMTITVLLLIETLKKE